MIKVLFICHGNICRSTMAEYVMKHLVKQSGIESDFFIDSAGTSNEEHGNPVHRGTQKKLRKEGIPCGNHRARKMCREEYAAFDYIICMERYNIQNIMRIIGNDPEHKVQRLLDYTNRPRDIADPWYTGNFDETFDDVMELFYSLRSPYRKKAVWVLNDSTVKALRKLKDNTGNYIWSPSVQAGVPDTILNRPYKTSSYVPEIKAGNKCMAFGDFSYYWVADRQGRSFKRLNELFAMTGQVGFLASQRLDGKLILPEAVKTLTIKKA